VSQDSLALQSKAFFQDATAPVDWRNVLIEIEFMSSKKTKVTPSNRKRQSSAKLMNLTNGRLLVALSHKYFAGLPSWLRASRTRIQVAKQVFSDMAQSGAGPDKTDSNSPGMSESKGMSSRVLSHPNCAQQFFAC